jgi:DNA-binding phage protein
MKKEQRFYFPKDAWGLTVVKAENGFVVWAFPGSEVLALENDKESERECDDVDAAKKLLWYILEYFNINPSRYVRRRLGVIEKVGEKYTLAKDEKFETEKILRAVKER